MLCCHLDTASKTVVSNLNLLNDALTLRRLPRGVMEWFRHCHSFPISHCTAYRASPPCHLLHCLRTERLGVSRFHSCIFKEANKRELLELGGVPLLIKALSDTGGNEELSQAIQYVLQASTSAKGEIIHMFRVEVCLISCTQFCSCPTGLKCPRLFCVAGCARTFGPSATEVGTASLCHVCIIVVVV